MIETAFDKIEKALLKPIRHLTPVEWAETYRYLSPDITPYPGRMSYSKTPYLKEIVNSFMPDDPAQIITFLKGSQIGASIGGIYSLIGWVISENPSNMLLMLHDDDGIKRAMQGPVDQMINDSGLADKIKATNVRGGRNQKSGDTNKGKEFPGGHLYTWSGQSIRKLSQISVRYIFADELERYKAADMKAGSVISLIESRAKAFKDTRKIFYTATPEIEQGSLTEGQYLKGDRRQYHMPCECCGEYIHLEWSLSVEGIEGNCGIIFERDKNGMLIEDSVRYRCQKCGGEFTETHKYDMLEADLCKWVPTANPESKIYKSYHLSALYAPVGMYDWTEYARQWCQIHPIDGPVKIEELKTFVNQVLGQTWKEQARSVKADGLIRNKRNIPYGIIPDLLSEEDGNGAIVLLTCAVDLNGKIGDKVEEDDVRLDYEVVAWCVNGDDDYVTSYSIDQGSIGTFERRRDQDRREKSGEYKDKAKWTYRHGYENSVWDYFEEKVMYKDWPKESGGKMRIMMTGVDTGNFTVYANEFVAKHHLCVALKGDSENQYTNYTKDKSYYKKGTKAKLYVVEGNRIKDRLADMMELPWDNKKGITQPLGYMNFPMADDGKYEYKTFFKEFEAEERKIKKDSTGSPIGMRWEKKHHSSANHFFDCRVYNIALQKIVTSMYCKGSKDTNGRPIDSTWENFCKLRGYH